MFDAWKYPNAAILLQYERFRLLNLRSWYRALQTSPSMVFILKQKKTSLQSSSVCKLQIYTFMKFNALLVQRYLISVFNIHGSALYIMMRLQICTLFLAFACLVPATFIIFVCWLVFNYLILRFRFVGVEFPIILTKYAASKVVIIF